MINIILHGQPKSTQHIYKMTCRGKFASMYMSKEGKELKEDYQWQIKSQFNGKPTNKPLEISVKIVYGTRRKADWDNFHKLSMDACTGLIWVDDSQIQIAHVYKDYDKDFPRIELSIKEI